MADKDKKLKVILKLPRPASRPPLSSSLASQHVQVPPSPGAAMQQKAAAGSSYNVAAAAVAGSGSNRLATPPKKRKYKALESESLSGPVKHEVPSPATTAAATPPSVPLRVRAPLPPLAKKASHEKEKKVANGEAAPPIYDPAPVPSGHVQVATTPPPKKVLEGVLDKLKKKDTYGVFSEPVDSRLVPDYYDVIKEPMDFGTMYKKISKGIYTALHLFEKDIMLICSNAMRYNGPETIYYKQAKSIQDAARKALDVVASQTGGADGGKTSSNKKKPHNAKKSLKTSAVGKASLDPANSDYASGATLATDGDEAAWSNKAEAGCGKKGAASDRSGSVGEETEAGWAVQSHGNSLLEWETIYTDAREESGAVLKPALKDGRRPLSTEEYHRSSYKPRNLPAHGRGPPLSGVGGELHHLVPTGYQVEHTYARSLSRFTANLGFKAWKFAAKKMQRVLPASVAFGPGWIGELEAPPGTVFRPRNLPERPPGSFSAAEVKVMKPAPVGYKAVSTSSNNPTGVGTVPHSSLRTSPTVVRAPTMRSMAQTSMDSLLTTVTSAVLASGSLSQPVSLGKPLMVSTSNLMKEESKPDVTPHSTVDVRQGPQVRSATGDDSRGPSAASSKQGLSAAGGQSVWVSESATSQNQALAAVSFQGGSRWTSQPQGAPSFVYSTAMPAVPSAFGKIVRHDEASNAQAHPLGSVQAESNTKTKLPSSMQPNMQMYPHGPQTPGLPQFWQPQMYPNPSSYDLHSSTSRPLAKPSSVLISALSSSQALSQHDKQESGVPALLAPQPLQLQMGGLSHTSPSQARPTTNASSSLQQQQSLLSHGPPDLNLQPVESRAPTPNVADSEQPSLALQL